MIQYEDFSLKIEPKHGEVYPVIVLSSPAGEGRSTFELPFDLDELGSILFELGLTVRGSRRVPLRDVSPAATHTGPQRIGDQLFIALFSGPVRSLLDRSLGMIHGRQRGLRIKLHIDPEDPSLAQLASLPWEFLYRKETRDFLNLSRFTPILRYLDVQRPYTPLPLELPLRILVVISDPTDYKRLDLDQERALIEASWAKQEGVQVEFMERATIMALQDRLAVQPYHVLHYMGHGDFDERTGQGVLVMEDEDGCGAMVDGSTLGVLLHDVSTMRLVFLNACETARVTNEKGLDPFAGVAAAMVMAGIPAVVAMQFPISDSAAITFSHKFYPLLARGEPVDAAVAEGRRAIRLAEAQTMEWGTPVLFMRAPQGVIFQVSEAQRDKVPLPQIPELPEEVDEALEERLAELYTRGLSAFWLEEWDKAVQSFQAIVSVRPDYEDTTNKLAGAKRQANLHTLFTQAQAAQEAEDWSGALAALEELAAEAADFKDIAERLQIVRKQKQLADLYGEAQRLHQAQQWQAVVNVFGQIQAIEPEYPDPDELLPTAEQEVAERKRQAKLNNLYSRAVREMDARQWQEARQLLDQVQEMEPGYRETEPLLARVGTEIKREEAEQRWQEQIATLYEQALGLAGDQQWQQVLAKMEEIQTLDPQFADPEGLAVRAQEKVERHRRLSALYAQAQAAQQAEDWSGALSALEELVAEAPNFKDAVTLLETTEKQRQLADLYAEARRLHQAKQWQAVVNIFAQIHAIQPEYPDPDGLLSTAEREAAALKRQAELNELYGRAVREMDAEHWAEARRLLAQVQAIEPSYRETERLLTEIEAEIEREEAERQRQEQIATLYEQALGLARARQWRQVLTKVEDIQNLDPHFADPERLAAKAREEVAGEEEEARRQSELAALYAEAVRLLKAGQYQEALEKWGEVRACDPRYPDRQKVQATASKKLAALARAAPTKRGLPKRAVVLVGGLALIAVAAVLVVVVLRRDGFEEWIARVPPTPVPAMVVPTPTPTRRPTPEALCEPGVLYCENFENGQANGWTTAGWKVERDGSNYVFSGSDSGDVRYTSLVTDQKWEDYRVRLRLRLLRGFLIISYRVDKSGSYLVTLDQNTLYLDKELAEGTYTYINLDRINVNLQPDHWYEVEIAGWGGHLQVYVDGQLELDYTDEDPLQQGTIAFETLDNSQAQVDDIQVMEPGPEPAPPPRQQCGPGVLFCDNFEDGRADGWEFGPGWQIDRDGSNYVLSGSGHKWATLRTGQVWDNYRVRFRLKLLKGAIHLNYRLAPGPEVGRYFIGFHQDGLYLEKSTESGGIELATTQVQHSLGQWHDVEIVGWGGHLQVYVDGELELDYTDEDPLQQGTIAFETLDNSQAQVDDIEIMASGSE
jgi:outer membrane protein assembly factor BamD (BamD/ComL family)